MDVLHKDVSKPKTVKQHFVPQFYLKEFTDSNEFIHVFNFETQKYHKSRPKDFCYQKNLYETQWENANSELGEYVLQNDIEKIFSNYEGKYAEFLKRLKNICTRSQNPNAIILSAKEKNIFYSFVVNFVVRNPESMNLLKLNEIPENINESECIMDIRRLLEELNFGGADSLIRAANKKVMLTEEMDDSFPLKCIEYIKNYKMQFFYAESESFLTSNLPVVVSDDSSIPDEDTTCIYFAITPKISVLIGNYKEFKNRSNHMVIIPEKIVDRLNSHIVKRANEYDLSIIGNSRELIEKYKK